MMVADKWQQRRAALDNRGVFPALLRRVVAVAAVAGLSAAAGFFARLLPLRLVEKLEYVTRSSEFFSL